MTQTAPPIPRLDQREYLCGGALVPWKGPFEPVQTPLVMDGDRPEIGCYPSMSREAALQCLDAAVDAYGCGRADWPSAPLAARVERLTDFVHRMQRTRDEVVNLIMWEIAKSRVDCEKEFDRTVTYIKDTVEAAKELDRASSRFTIAEGIFAQIRRAPLGVCLCMGPFNYPLNETYTTLIPALLMGNTILFKPPKIGILLHRPLLDAFRESFPPGVVNTVYGDAPTVIPPLMESGKIDVLAFIGSSRVAGTLERYHPKPHRLRTVLGLEAKNPAIVLPDAEISQAVEECVLGSLSFNGQRCTALKILFVHRDIFQSFLERFIEEMGSLKRGMPWDAGVKITPLAEPNKAAYLQELVDDAVRHGARVFPEAEFCDGGWGPRVVAPVTTEMRAYHEEQFGPLVPIVSFDRVEEVISYVVASSFGQQVSLFGRDPESLSRLIDPLVNQVCRVNINSQCQRGPDVFPFTGRKDSAEATLSVSDALRAFSIRTMVAAKGSEENKEILRSIVQDRRSKFLSTDFVF